MINHQLRCIYVHIPKTAGNSVNRVFGIDWADHQDLQRYADEMPPADFARYYKFAIVRNPWERIFSDYNYQRKKSRARDSKLFLYDDADRQRSFRDWVHAALADPHRYEPSRWGGRVSAGLHRWSPQVDWITVNGEPQLDFLVRMENLQDDFAEVGRVLGLPLARLPRRNRRLHGHYSWYYDDATRDLVSDYYAHDIAAFGYRFEASPGSGLWHRGRSLAATVLHGLRTPVTLTSVRFR